MNKRYGALNETQVTTKGNQQNCHAQGNQPYPDGIPKMMVDMPTRETPSEKTTTVEGTHSCPTCIPPMRQVP